MMASKFFLVIAMYVAVSTCTVHNLYFSNGCRGSNEVGVVGAPQPRACSMVAATVDDATNELNAWFKWDVGADAATEGHIHWNGTATQSSPLRDVIFSGLGMGVTEFQVTGFTLTAQAVADMIAVPSKAYFNLHTTALPSGALRGQLSTTAPTYPVFFMNGCVGDNEVGTTGSPSGSWCGETNLMLNRATNQVTGSITWETPGDTVTAGHIHFGADKTANSGMIFDLGISGTSTSPYTVAVTLNNTAVSEIEIGHAYLNLHTTTYPSGALRAQLHSGANSPPRRWIPVWFENGCNGLNEVGTVGSPTATCALQYGRIDELEGHFSGKITTGLTDVTEIHIHYGANANANAGTKEVILMQPPGAGPFSWEATNITAQTVTDIKAETAYVNIHTTALPSGAVRGQLTDQRTVFQVVPMQACPGIEVCDYESTAAFDMLRNISFGTQYVFRVEKPAAWVLQNGTISAGYFRFILNNVNKPATGNHMVSWKLYDGQVLPAGAGAVCTDDFTCTTAALPLCNVAGRIGVDSSNYCIQNDSGPWHIVLTAADDVEIQAEFELYNNAACAVASLDCTLTGPSSSASVIGASFVALALFQFLVTLMF